MGTVKKVLWTVNEWNIQEKIVSTMDKCIPLVDIALEVVTAALASRHRLSKKHHKNKGTDLSSIVTAEDTTGAKKTEKEVEITKEKTDKYLEFAEEK